MRKYQIIALVIGLFVSNWAMAQFQVTTRPPDVDDKMYDQVKWYHCMECDNINWNISGVPAQAPTGADPNQPISCANRNYGVRASFKNNKFWSQLNYINQADQEVRFPTDKYAVIVENEDTNNNGVVDGNEGVLELIINHHGKREKRSSEQRMRIFIGKLSNNGNTREDVTTQVIRQDLSPYPQRYEQGGYRFNLGRNGFTWSRHFFQFREPGLYFIYTFVNFNKRGRYARITGWVYVRPKLNSESTTFSACYVGPDLACPGEFCECTDDLPDGVGDTDYYGTPNAVYQARLKMNDAGVNGTTNYFSYYANASWFNDQSPNRTGAQIDATAQTYLYRRTDSPNTNPIRSRRVGTIKYRMDGPDDKANYEEFLYIQSVKDGLKSAPTVIKMRRNLKPLPLYRYELGCFGHEIKLINQTQFYESSPEILRYVWHLGDGSRVTYPTTGSFTKRDWADLPSYEYTTEGDYTPILQVEYSYDTESCPVRSVYSRVDLLTDEDNILPSDVGLSLNDAGDATELIIRYRKKPDGTDDLSNPREVANKEQVYLPIPVRSLTQSDEVATYTTYTLPNTLGASAASFSDSWVMDLGSTTEATRNANPFVNGQRGLWRGEGSFAYIGDRLGANNAENGNKLANNSDVSINTYGQFTFNAFNWNVHAGPKWVKANTITEYSPYGSEIENRDVLNRYSTAIFGYNGQLTTAVAANMQNRELAFTSFEEGVFFQPNPVFPGIIQQAPFNQANAGNLNIINMGGAKLRTIPVTGGNQEVGIIQYPFSKIDELRNLSLSNPLTLKGQNIDNGQAFVFDNVALTCKFRHTQDAEKSIVRFSGAGLDLLSTPWQGELSYYDVVTPQLIAPAVAKVVDDAEKAHTGTRSLEVLQNFDQEQLYLQLIADKEYVVGAWVKVEGLAANELVATYQTTDASEDAEKLGIAVKIKGGTEYLAVFEPTGPIIEGWQRIQGKFKYPDAVEDLYIGFQRGSAFGADASKRIYFDDIRLFANLGNMQSYVYDRVTYRLKATLDNNNYATLYSYDSEGNLFLIKKETVRGIKTIQESMSHQKGEDEY